MVVVSSHEQRGSAALALAEAALVQHLLHEAAEGSAGCEGLTVEAVPHSAADAEL
jgi:hypothetical protein